MFAALCLYADTVLEVGPVWHTSTSLDGLKTYRHFFLTIAAPVCRNGSLMATKLISYIPNSLPFFMLSLFTKD